MSSVVTRIHAAHNTDALTHFESLLQYETDCWDVHHAISNQRRDFMLIDVRGEKDYLAGHLPEAIHIPHTRINEKTFIDIDPNTLCVVYCAGPHCNGADKAAVRLAKLKRPVKKMIGGVTGWRDEGFQLIQQDAI